MEILYKSTRGSDKNVTASKAILKGLASDGGLFVPDSIPALPDDLGKLAECSYQELAYIIMSRYFTDYT
ncbi:MAG TPA: threonine synthase, partial [Candidatus Alectryocaccobium stercorigallinarum]|nr:threonine synthase [Candidatus Alectryocaccobium stercorigallinarum]